MLASLYTWLRFSGLVTGPDKPNAWLALPDDPKRLYAIGFVLFLLALLAKTTASVLPACVLLLTWWKRGRLSWKQDVVPMLPLFVVGLAFARLTSWLEVHRVGASGPDWVYAQTPIGQFLAETLIAGRALWFYVGKLVYPHPLIFNYPRFEPDLGNALQWLFPAAALAMLVFVYVARQALGRGPLTAALWFVGVSLPALGYFNVLPHKYSFVADHFVYVASLGLITLFSAGVATLWRARRWKPVFGVVLAGALLFVLTGLSYRQARAYADEETLWRDTLAKNPTSWIAANNLGVILMERGELDRADELFARVLELKPDHVEVRLNIGLLNEKRGGKLADSVQWYQDAVKLEPRYAPAWHRLGLAYQRSAKQLRTQAAELTGWDRWFRAHRLRSLSDRYLDAALRSYNNALSGDPRYLPSLLQQSSLLLEYGRFVEAIPLLRRALVVDERNAQARANLFFALVTVGSDREREEAVGIWNELTQENPNDIRAYNLLGLSLARRNEWSAAAGQFERTVRIDPRFVEGWYNLGLARLEGGDRNGALAALTQALQIDPHYGPAQRVLRRIQSQPAGQPATLPATQPAS
jgi:tetratricopeptide (TPR) repeat protein